MGRRRRAAVRARRGAVEHVMVEDEFDEMRNEIPCTRRDQNHKGSYFVKKTPMLKIRYGVGG